MVKKLPAMSTAPKTPESELRNGVPVLQFTSPAAWEKWLKRHHASQDPIWIKFAKKASGLASVNYAQALEIALCWGWIDGQVAPVDETFYLQRWTRRRAKSKWSKVNRGKVETLLANGRMQPSGLKEVEAAKADGRWDAAYDSHRTITDPPDFLKALKATHGAHAFYKTISKSARYSLLHQIHDAKRPETRARRIAEFVAMLADRRTRK